VRTEVKGTQGEQYPPRSPDEAIIIRTKHAAEEDGLGQQKKNANLGNKKGAPNKQQGRRNNGGHKEAPWNNCQENHIEDQAGVKVGIMQKVE